MHPGMNFLSVHEKQTENFTHFLVKQNENFFKKMILIGNGTFCFEIPGDISLQCSEHQYHLTKSYCLANISPSTYTTPKLADLSSALTMVICIAIFLCAIFLSSYIVIKKSIIKLHSTK